MCPEIPHEACCTKTDSVGYLKFHIPEQLVFSLAESEAKNWGILPGRLSPLTMGSFCVRNGEARPRENGSVSSPLLFEKAEEEARTHARCGSFAPCRFAEPDRAERPGAAVTVTGRLGGAQRRVEPGARVPTSPTDSAPANVSSYKLPPG